MTEKTAPTINRVLFVSEQSRKAMQAWPLELRALFDPQADRALAERVNRAKLAREAALKANDEEEIPF